MHHIKSAETVYDRHKNSVILQITLRQKKTKEQKTINIYEDHQC